MNLPDYSELSNFSTRVNGRKIVTDLSVVLLVNRESDPVSAINSIYQFVGGSSKKTEFILVNMDKEGFQYDKLLDAFPVMRAILPMGKIRFEEAIQIAILESLSKNILFMDEHFVIRNLSLDVLSMYLSESSFGAFIPWIVNEKEETVPNIIKGSLNRGFIETISTDIVGTAVSSIYPKYFCFLLNRDAFLSRNIMLNSYREPAYTMLELGYKLWKEGFIITQIRNFKVVYRGSELQDITRNLKDGEYLSFNLLNITSPDVSRGRKRAILLQLASLLIQLRFFRFADLRKRIRQSRDARKNNQDKPVEDSTFFSIINRDMK